MTVPVESKKRITLLRYEDSGTAMVWLEGGGDKSPVVAIDLLTGIDISSSAREVAIEKCKENEGKLRYMQKRIATQGMAEYAFTCWHEKEGVKLDKKRMTSQMRAMKWHPSPMLRKNGWTVTVIGTTDYHGDLIVEDKHLSDQRHLFVHAVRFGTNEKIIFKGWTSAKYLKLAGIASTNEYKSKGGRNFTNTKYAMDPGELFPMSLLRGQIDKRTATKKKELKKEKRDDFGF